MVWLRVDNVVKDDRTTIRTTPISMKVSPNIYYTCKQGSACSFRFFFCIFAKNDTKFGTKENHKKSEQNKENIIAIGYDVTGYPQSISLL